MRIALRPRSGANSECARIHRACKPAPKSDRNRHDRPVAGIGPDATSPMPIDRHRSRPKARLHNPEARLDEMKTGRTTRPKARRKVFVRNAALVASPVRAKAGLLARE